MDPPTEVGVCISAVDYGELRPSLGQHKFFICGVAHRIQCSQPPDSGVAYSLSLVRTERIGANHSPLRSPDWRIKLLNGVTAVELHEAPSQEAYAHNRDSDSHLKSPPPRLRQGCCKFIAPN